MCSNCLEKRQPAVVRLVTDEEIDTPAFILDLKDFGQKLPIPRRGWVDFLVNRHRDAATILVDARGNPVEIDYEELERDNIDLWFRDWLKRHCGPVGVRVRPEARERVRLVATMLRIIFPKESAVWGQPPVPLQLSN